MTYEFNHVHIKAPDPEKTAKWYVEAFGFKIVGDEVRGSGDRFIRLDTVDGLRFSISGARTNEEMRDGEASAHWGLEHFGLNVDDLDAEIERLTSLGAELLEGPIDPSGGLRIAFMKIPDNVRIELLQLPKN